MNIRLLIYTTLIVTCTTTTLLSDDIVKADITTGKLMNGVVKSYFKNGKMK